MTGDSPRPPLRVALVDDHELVRIGIVELLADQPTIDVVASTSSVSDLFAHPVELDLVVLDLRLSDGSTPGANVATIREHGLEALVLTGGDDPRLVRSAAREGVLGVIRKAAPASELIDALVRAGAGETVAAFAAHIAEADMALAAMPSSAVSIAVPSSASHARWGRGCGMKMPWGRPSARFARIFATPSSAAARGRETTPALRVEARLPRLKPA